MTETPEKDESLWWLAVPPTIWVTHFLASYVTAAIFCAKATGMEATLTNVRIDGFIAVDFAGFVNVVDALGGVTNFIIDRQFQGLKINAGTGIAEQGDADREPHGQHRSEGDDRQDA